MYFYILPSWDTMAITLRHTYSSIFNWNWRKMAITLVIFSTMLPTSCLNWSMVMGLPIIDVRHVCRVTRLVATCKWNVLWLQKDCTKQKQKVTGTGFDKLPLGGAQPSRRRFGWCPSGGNHGWLDRPKWSTPGARATCEWGVGCVLLWAVGGRRAAESPILLACARWSLQSCKAYPPNRTNFDWAAHQYSTC